MTRPAPTLAPTLALAALLLGPPGPGRASSPPEPDAGATTTPAPAVAAPGGTTPGARLDLQATWVLQRKPAFAADYTGQNSLLPTAETGFTLTGTASAGLRAWRGGELFADAEGIQAVAMSKLHGLGGFNNGENQKSGGVLPTFYLARLFLRQTFDLGGEPVAVEPGVHQLGGATTRRRLVVTAGKLSVVDVFDQDPYAHDARTQFLNWTLLTFGASDYAADARGYTVGASVEYLHDDWAVRLGRFAQPAESNGLALNYDLLESYGDSLEVSRAHDLLGLPGQVRLAGWRNVARMGAFQDALDDAAAHGTTPSVADVRRSQSKLGFGLAVDQALPAGLGLFVRYSWNDGITETYAFAEVERSLTAGVSARGSAWRRGEDSAGLALVQNGLGTAHRAYLAAGGMGAFIGDGRLDYAPERILEAWYALVPARGFQVSADYQLVVHPAYNAARGPASFFGARVHLEY